MPSVSAATESDFGLLRALADPQRANLLAVIAAAGCPVCVCDMAELVGLSQPTVSHHLRVLRDAGLVLVERRGTWAYYELATDARDRAMRSVDSFFLQGVLA